MTEENRFVEHYISVNDHHMKNMRRNNTYDDTFRGDPSGVYRFILGTPIMDISTTMTPGHEEFIMYRMAPADVEVEVDVCSDMYAQNSQLPVLKLTKRKNAGRQGGEHKCKVCFKTFSQFVNLATHERVHTGERPFRCEVCLKTFTQQPNLWKHIRTHTGERPYRCEICNKRFTQQANLTKHIRTHTGERPYPCHICGKCFSQQANLNKHIRLHTGERPFHCRFCTKTFVQQSNLDRHERTHTGVKPYTCKICWKSFGQNGNLLKHLSTHQGGDGQSQVFYSEEDKQNLMKKESVTFCDLDSKDTVNVNMQQCQLNQPDNDKKYGIPVLVCTRTGKILKRVE